MEKLHLLRESAHDLENPKLSNFRSMIGGWIQLWLFDFDMSQGHGWDVNTIVPKIMSLASSMMYRRPDLLTILLSRHGFFQAWKHPHSPEKSCKFWIQDALISSFWRDEQHICQFQVPEREREIKKNSRIRLLPAQCHCSNVFQR